MKKILNTTVLQVKNRTPYEKNMDKLFKYPENLEIVINVAPEVFNDYDYENIEEACELADMAEEILKKVIKEQIFNYET